MLAAFQLVMEATARLRDFIIVPANDADASVTSGALWKKANVGMENLSNPLARPPPGSTLVGETVET